MDLRKKSDVLWDEALKDLDVGCYNKAVSASYFSVRLAAESVLKGLKTSKDDKIANALERVLSKKLGKERAKEMRDRYMGLYAARKLADHRAFSFDRELASSYVKMAKELRKVILSLASGDRVGGADESMNNERGRRT